jgi:hypothetical protein
MNGIEPLRRFDLHDDLIGDDEIQAMLTQELTSIDNGDVLLRLE